MKVPVQWLADHLAELPPLAELSERLSLAGDKVEAVERRELGEMVAEPLQRNLHRTAPRNCSRKRTSLS